MFMIKGSGPTILFFSFLFCSVYGSAQIFEKDDDHFVVYITSAEFSVKAHVSSYRSRKSAKRNIEYAWYSSNTILYTYGGYEGKLLDGPFASMYWNNNLREKGNYKKGFKDGKWILWYADGKIMKEQNWKNGRITAEKNYNSHGNLITRSRFRRPGFLLKEHYENGKLILKESYRNGILIKKTPDGHSAVVSNALSAY